MAECAYEKAGILTETVNIYGEVVPQIIPIEVMEKLSLEARVDISPQNPYSRFAQEQALQNLLGAGYITFEEYVEALDDDAASPKAKLSDIIQKRKAAAQRMQQELIKRTAENTTDDTRQNARENLLVNNQKEELQKEEAQRDEYSGRINTGY